MIYTAGTTFCVAVFLAEATGPLFLARNNDRCSCSTNFARANYRQVKLLMLNKNEKNI